MRRNRQQKLRPQLPVRALPAEVPVFLAPNATSPAPGQERYIVALASGGRANQLALGGGSIEREAGLYAQLMVPAAALDGLRHNPKVRYIQRVLPPSEAADLLRNQSAPEGAVSAASIAPSLVTAPMSTTVWDSGTFTYDGMGNITAMGGSSYTYDKVARLVQSTTQSNGVGWAETYAYDAFGNMTSKTTNGAPLPIPVNVYTNRLNGASYDIAGNVTWDGVHTFQYDPFGQPREISESGGLILYPIYDADGERIGLVTEGSNEWKWTPRDLSGKVAREYVGLGGSVGQPQNFFYVWKEDYVYRGGLLAGAVRETAEGGLRHFHLDHLGTPRVTTNASGQVISKNDYYPFGQEITSMRQQIAAGYDRDDPMKFTGHERDFIGGTYTENTDNLDYMHAREYNAGLARFMTVDPYIGSAVTHRPQLWNRYAYVGDNSINFTDPYGLFEWRFWRWSKDTELPKSQECFECLFYGVKPDITVVAKDPGPKIPKPRTFESSVDSLLFNLARGTGALDIMRGIRMNDAGDVGVGLGKSIFAAAASSRLLGLVYDVETLISLKESGPPKPPGSNEQWQWRAGSRGRNPKSWWDPEGGEWRWHEADKYHSQSHWDYNAWDNWNTPWGHIEP